MKFWKRLFVCCLISEPLITCADNNVTDSSAKGVDIFVATELGAEVSIPILSEELVGDGKSVIALASSKPPVLQTIKHYAGGILLGQVMSLIIAGTNVCNAIAAPVTFPIVQNAVIYPVLLLAMAVPFGSNYLKDFLGSLLSNGNSRAEIFQGSVANVDNSGLRKLTIWGYLLFASVMAMADVGANAAIVQAFQTTSSLSAMLISSTSTVLVIGLATLVLRNQYKIANYAGGLVCLAGLGMILAAKSQGASYDGQTFVGDMLALLAALGYAISNVFNERIARIETGYPKAALASMGAFGTVFSGLLLASPLGRNDIYNLQHLTEIPGFEPNNAKALIVYPFLMISLYTLVPRYFQKYSSIMFNLNIITADLYVLLYNVIFKPENVAQTSALFKSGMAFIFLGLFLYGAQEPGVRPRA